MRNVLLCLLLIFVSFTVFAQKASVYSIYILPVSGTGKGPDDNEFFYRSLVREVSASNYVLAADQNGADLILTPKLSQIPGQNPSEQLYTFHVSLIDNRTNSIISEQELIYASLEEVNTPLKVMTGTVFSGISRGTYVDADAWRNKWLYLRISADYTVAFYGLKPNDLFAGQAMTATALHPNPGATAPIDNKTVTVPGLTVGLEVVQFLNWLSYEVNLQLSMGDPSDNTCFNAAVGAEIKIPLNVSTNLIVEPYAAFSYPLTIPPAYSETPGYALGGGLQLGAKGSDNGILFIDIRFMYYPADAILKNPYVPLFDPEVIHYKHFTLGFGIGYKIGFFDRK